MSFKTAIAAIFLLNASTVFAADAALPAAAVPAAKVKPAKMTPAGPQAKPAHFVSVVLFPETSHEKVRKDLADSCAKANVLVSSYYFDGGLLHIDYESKGEPKCPDQLKTRRTWKTEAAARNAMERVVGALEKKGFCFYYQNVRLAWEGAWTYSVDYIY